MVSKKVTVLLSIVVLASFLRIYRIGSRPLYGDELFSLHWSSYSVKEFMTKGALRGNEKPLYFLMLHFWRKYISDSEVTMRYLSVIAGVLSITLIFMLAEKLTDTEIGLLSAFFLAISPFHIYYSQEIRMYTLETLFALISFYLFLRFLVSGSRIKLSTIIWYIIASSVAIHMHIAAILMILVQNIYFFLRRKDANISIKKWISIQIFILLLTPQVIIPFFYIFGYKYANWRGYIPEVADKTYNLFPIIDIPKTYSVFSIGFLVTELKGNLHIVLPAFLFFASAFLLGLRKILTFWQKNGYLLLLWCFIPVFALFFILILLGSPYVYRSRYVFISSFAYYIILAMGIESVKNRFLKFTLIFCIIIFSIISLNDYYKFKNLFTKNELLQKNYCLISGIINCKNTIKI